MLQAAANVSMSESSAFEMLDYIISLREGIMDAWSGAILAMKQTKCKCYLSIFVLELTFLLAQLLTQFVEPIFHALNVVARDPNRSEALLRSAMGVVGYVTFFDMPICLTSVS